MSYNVNEEYCMACGQVIRDSMEPHYCPIDLEDEDDEYYDEDEVDYGDEEEQWDDWDEVDDLDRSRLEDEDDLPF